MSGNCLYVEVCSGVRFKLDGDEAIYQGSCGNNGTECFEKVRLDKLKKRGALEADADSVSDFYDATDDFFRQLVKTKKPVSAFPNVEASGPGIPRSPMDFGCWGGRI